MGTFLEEGSRIRMQYLAKQMFGARGGVACDLSSLQLVGGSELSGARWQQLG